MLQPRSNARFHPMRSTDLAQVDERSRKLAASNPLLQAVAEICLWIAYEKLNNEFSATQPLVIPKSDIVSSRDAISSTPQRPYKTAPPN